jgi:hypothetical protein
MEIFNHNINAIASLCTIFVSCFHLGDDDEIINATNQAILHSVNVWYNNNKSREFDIMVDRVEPEAIKFAGLMLLKIKELTDATAKLMRFDD